MVGVRKAAPAAIRDVRLVYASRFVLRQPVREIHLRRSRPAVVGCGLDLLRSLSPADFGFDAGGDLLNWFHCVPDFGSRWFGGLEAGCQQKGSERQTGELQ